MTPRWLRRIVAVILGMNVTLSMLTPKAMAQWPQWGGPNRDFKIETTGLADKWPDGGPRQIWKRTLGTGYSSIIADSGTLYTVYRKTKTDPNERVVALKADTGTSIWEYPIPSPVPQSAMRWGLGPNATPLIVQDHLYVASAHGKLHSLEAKTGKLLWERDLRAAPGSPPLPDGYGYSPSPLRYRDTIIVPADVRSVAEVPVTPGPRDGAATHALVAFDPESGKPLWVGGRFTMGHSSPMVINFDGEDQLVLFAKEGLFGFDPSNGVTLWHLSIEANGTNDAIMMPLWDRKDSLFVVSHGEYSGGRMVQLSKQEGKTVPTELWFNRDAFFGNLAPVRIGENLVGSKNNAMIGVKGRSGKVAWRTRVLEGALCLWTDNKLILLDMNGQLALARVTRDGVAIRSQCQMTTRFSMTIPTLVGTTLYLRDESHIMALDVGKPQPHMDN